MNKLKEDYKDERNKTYMKKILFIIKQLLPLTYYTKYRVQDNKELAIWTQWFGKPFNIKRFELKN